MSSPTGRERARSTTPGPALPPMTVGVPVVRRSAHVRQHVHPAAHVTAPRGVVPTGDGASRRPWRWLCEPSC